MACYHAIPARQQGASVKLWPPLGYANLAIPCGRCIGCLAARANQWAQRCTHEATQWQNNIFVTLTYDDEHLPTGGHLDAGALTRFIKRARKQSTTGSTSIISDRRSTLRYLACGEYGETNQRPHYHALIFNHDYGDKRRATAELYESDELARIWGNGQARFGPATPAAANYIAQYTIKKGFRNRSARKDDGWNNEGYADPDGVWHPKPEPFLRVSTKPAIGLRWLEKYKEDLQHGYLEHDGYQQAIPRAYKRYLDKHDPGLLEDINIRTLTRLRDYPNDKNDPARIAAAELIHKNRNQNKETRHL